MEAEIAANDAADRETRRRHIRNIIVTGVIIFAAIGGYLLLRPHPEPDVYYKDGDIDYMAQADKLRRSGKFKDVYAFRAGYAIVSDGRKFGIVDVKGNIVCPVKYDEIESNYSEHFPDLAMVRVGKKYGLVDKNGKEVVKVAYDDIAPVTMGTFKVSQNGHEFYIDTNGNKVNAQ